MFRIFAIILLLLHGLIHLMGFARAFHFGQMQQITKEVSKIEGISWLLTACIFVLSATLLALKREAWWIPGLIAIILSQALIIITWHDARFGTIANILLQVAVLAGLGQWQFQNKFYWDVSNNLQTRNPEPKLITTQDLQHLPAPVQRYLVYTGTVGKPAVRNMRVTMEGRMRDRKRDWFSFTTVQYNFYNVPARLFFMKGKMYGLTVPGYHAYNNGTAGMDIRLFGTFPVMQASGPEMNIAETVTLLNDMCFMAPATLTDKRIRWEAINDTSARAFFR